VQTFGNAGHSLHLLENSCHHASCDALLGTWAH